MARREYSEETKAAVMAKQECYIYGLRVMGSPHYFYVGSTQYDPQERLKSHLYDVTKGFHKNRHFCNKVRKAGIDNVVCDVLEVTNSLERWVSEKRWIEQLLAQGHRLVNRIHNEIEFEMTDYRTFELSPERWEQAQRLADGPAPPAKRVEWQKLVDMVHAMLRGLVEVGRAHGYHDQRG